MNKNIINNDELTVASLSIQQFEIAKQIFDYSTRSVHWDKYNLKQEKNTRSFSLEKALIKFRSSDIYLSEGLDDSMHAYINNRFTVTLIKEIMDYCGENFFYDNLPKTQVGYPEHVFKVGDFVGLDYNEIRMLPWLKDLSGVKNNYSSILEIGGGYSCFGRMLISAFQGKYVNIELPNSLLLANYFLRMHFPEFKFFPLERCIEEKIVRYEDWLVYDIFLLPPGITFEDKIQFELAVNTRSMMEMRAENISMYFDLIHKHLAEEGHFLNINRIEKLTDGYPHLFCEYPYDEHWSVVYGKVLFNQKYVYSLLAKRLSPATTGNIKVYLDDLRDSHNYTYWVPNKFGPLIKRILFIIQKAFRKILFVTAMQMSKISEKILKNF